MADRRSVLGVVLDHVVVHPFPRGSGRFHPERVELVWAGQAGHPLQHQRYIPSPRTRRAPGATYTTREAGRFIGVHEQTILRFIRQGTLTATRPGKNWQITQAALDAFLATRAEPVARASDGHLVPEGRPSSSP